MLHFAQLRHRQKKINKDNLNCLELCVCLAPKSVADYEDYESQKQYAGMSAEAYTPSLAPPRNDLDAPCDTC